MSSNYRTKFYAEYVTSHQGEIDEARAAPALRSQILGHVPSDRSTRILDIGCGQGQLVRVLRAAGYQDVTGIDDSEEQVALAHRLGTQDIAQVDLFAYSDGNIGKYDVVLAVDLVEHFDRHETDQLFRTIRRLLRPQGTVVLRTPNGASPFCGRLLFGDITHGMAHTTTSLQQIAKVTGFSGCKTYPARPAGRGWKQLVRRSLWRAIEGILAFFLVTETGILRGHIVTQNLVGVMTADAKDVRASG